MLRDRYISKKSIYLTGIKKLKIEQKLKKLIKNKF